MNATNRVAGRFILGPFLLASTSLHGPERNPAGNDNGGRASLAQRDPLREILACLENTPGTHHGPRRNRRRGVRTHSGDTPSLDPDASRCYPDYETTQRPGPVRDDILKVESHRFAHLRRSPLESRIHRGPQVTQQLRRLLRHPSRSCQRARQDRFALPPHVRRVPSGCPAPARREADVLPCDPRQSVTSACSLSPSRSWCSPRARAAHAFPLEITTTSLSHATAGAAYSDSVVAANGTTPYAWSLDSGSLPGGITLDPGTGALTGSATVAATTSFIVRVEDAVGDTATRVLAITVDPAAAAALAFVQQPTTVAAGATIDPAVDGRASRTPTATWSPSASIELTPAVGTGTADAVGGDRGRGQRAVSPRSPG